MHEAYDIFGMRAGGALRMEHLACQCVVSGLLCTYRRPCSPFPPFSPTPSVTWESGIGHGSPTPAIAEPHLISLLLSHQHQSITDTEPQRLRSYAPWLATFLVPTLGEFPPDRRYHLSYAHNLNEAASLWGSGCHVVYLYSRTKRVCHT